MRCACSTSSQSISHCATTEDRVLPCGMPGLRSWGWVSWPFRGCVLKQCCRAMLLQRFDENELEFQEKILYRSGLGDDTSVPPCEFAIATAAVINIAAEWHNLWFAILITMLAQNTQHPVSVLPWQKSLNCFMLSFAMSKPCASVHFVALQGCTASPSALTMLMPARSLRSPASQPSGTF